MASSCPTGCTNEKRSPKMEWGAEARRAELCGSFICRPQAPTYAGIYWEKVGRLRGPRPNGVAC